MDLIESNGVKEVHDAHQSAVVMIQDVLGLLESHAVKRQGSDIGEVDSDAVMVHEGSREKEDAMTDDIAERGEAMSDGDGEQDKTKENTTNDKFTVQEEDDEEFTALNAKQES